MIKMCSLILNATLLEMFAPEMIVGYLTTYSYSVVDLSVCRTPYWSHRYH